MFDYQFLSSFAVNLCLLFAFFFRLFLSRMTFFGFRLGRVLCNLGVCVWLFSWALCCHCLHAYHRRYFNFISIFIVRWIWLFRVEFLLFCDNFFLYLIRICSTWIPIRNDCPVTLLSSLSMLLAFGLFLFLLSFLKWTSTKYKIHERHTRIFVDKSFSMEDIGIQESKYRNK